MARTTTRKPTAADVLEALDGQMIHGFTVKMARGRSVKLAGRVGDCPTVQLLAELALAPQKLDKDGLVAVKLPTTHSAPANGVSLEVPRFAKATQTTVSAYILASAGIVPAKAAPPVEEPVEEPKAEPVGANGTAS